MLSGQLHTDQRFSYHQEPTPTGYRARLKGLAPGSSSRTVCWGVVDIRKEALAKHFISPQKPVFELDFAPHAYWLQFQITNSGGNPQELVLELDKHICGTMDLFLSGHDETGIKQADFVQSIPERDTHYKHLALTFTVPSGVHTYYLRMDGHFTDVIPLRLWEKERFYRHTQADLALLGIMAGIFLFIILYTLVLFGLVGDWCYAYLALLTLCSLAIHLCVTGFGFQVIWSHSALWSLNVVIFAMPLSFIFFILFCRAFLESSEYTPIYDKVLLAEAAVFVILLPLAFILPDSIRNYLLLFYIFSDSCFFLPVLYLAVVAIRYGHRAGGYILAGISFFIISVAEGYLSRHDIIPFQLVNYLHFRGISFIVIMTWGLFDQINGLKNALARVNVDLERTLRDRTAASGQTEAGFSRQPSEIHYMTDNSERGRQDQKRLTEETRIRLETVKAILDQSFTEEISRDDLATKISMSPDHLGRMFKKYTGEKINAYVTRLRVAAAADKLIRTEDKIIDIAFSVGFSSLRTFNQKFRLIMGTTPSNFRQKNIL